MYRKLYQISLLILILLTVATAPTPVDGADNLVGLKIPASEMTTFSRIDQGEVITIDYGTFIWVVAQQSDLNRFDENSLHYQRFDQPYLLTLGGQSFDPLRTQPSFGTQWEEKPVKKGPELHLVQFQGPTKSEWLDSLSMSGIDVIQYIHPFTYVVWAEPLALEQNKTAGFVRWTGDYLPAYAVQPMNRVLGSDAIPVRVMLYPRAGLENTLTAIESIGGLVTGISSGVDPAFDLISIMLPGDRISSVAALRGVYAVQPVPTDGGDRGEMSNQINIGRYDANFRAYPGYRNWLNTIGLSGQGVVIANVDSGINQNHPDLINRMLPCTGSTCGGDLATNHGTHTAGIMAGDGSSGFTDVSGFLRGLGMAPGANLVEQAYTLVSTDPDQMSILIQESHQNGAVISGNSWGPSSEPLGYDLDTRLVDIGVRDADPNIPGNQSLSYILSIMNGSGGTSTQGTPDEAKNILTIGSTYMQFSDGSQNLAINDLSPNTAHGPALDGRIIPHLVAPGCYVDSTYQTGTGYGLMCGTSMASPQVSGAAALFYERYRNLYGVNPSPALVKAAFLPVAHDLAGYLDADNVVMGHPFDAKQGWGRLNAAAVLSPSATVTYYDQPTVLNHTGDSWQINLDLQSPINELRAMLVWTDAPGHGLGGSTPAWVNDLDLTISAGGQTFFGNNFGTNGYSMVGGIPVPDQMNNTEGIFLPASPAGTYTITVTAAQISGDGVPNFGSDTDQDFALVLYISSAIMKYEYIFPIFLYD